MTARRAALGTLIALLVLATGARGVAHTGGSTGYAAVAIDGAKVRYTLTLWPATLPPTIAAELQRVRTGQAAERERWVTMLREKIILTADGRRCEVAAGSVVPTATESAVFALDVSCAEPIRDLLVRDDLFDVLGPDHHTHIRIDGAARTWQFALAPDIREARVRLQETGGALGVMSFVRLGIEHILTGWDHLLFLLALLVPGGGVLAFVKIVTAFTLAHSVTLSLAVLDIVTLPGRLVEAVIALSIAAVAAENLLLRTTVTRRWVVSFGFGLVHGFGFSSALREVGLPADGVLVPLVGFNAGVELGQGLVVAVALPALLAVRRRTEGRRWIRGSSLVILLVGLVLFVERVFL